VKMASWWRRSRVGINPPRSDGAGYGIDGEHVEGSVHRSFIRSGGLFRIQWLSDASALCSGGSGPSSSGGAAVVSTGTVEQIWVSSRMTYVSGHRSGNREAWDCPHSCCFS
jgi:hypothetical protein